MSENCAPKKVEELQTPALVIYKHKLEENVRKMNKRAQEYGIKLRPHLKTTKCVEAGVIQTNGTKRCMVVSTIPEAEVLCENGFVDILYGVPLSQSRLARCASISEKMEDFSVFLDRIEMVDVLEEHKLSGNKKWGVFVKVDCDNGRAGILYNTDEAISLIQRLAKSNSINFKGLYAHCGNSYKADSIAYVHEVASHTTECVLKLVDKLKKLNISCPTYGIGSTPSCSNPSPIMKELTEWHPGNYVLYDVAQMRLGSCCEPDIASFVVTRVIGHYPQNNHLLVDCGFTALSLHGGGDCYGKTPGNGYGIISGHPELKLYLMHQEHGLIKPKDDSAKLNFASYPIGMLLRIFPDHSCATCAMHRTFYIADDNDVIIEQWVPVSGW